MRRSVRKYTRLCTALDQLTSQRYWEKWDRVSEADITEIARRFFSRVWELESPEAIW